MVPSQNWPTGSTPIPNTSCWQCATCKRWVPLTQVHYCTGAPGSTGGQQA